MSCDPWFRLKFNQHEQKHCVIHWFKIKISPAFVCLQQHGHIFQYSNHRECVCVSACFILCARFFPPQNWTVNSPLLKQNLQGSIMVHRLVFWRVTCWKVRCTKMYQVGRAYSQRSLVVGCFSKNLQLGESPATDHIYGDWWLHQHKKTVTYPMAVQ